MRKSRIHFDVFSAQLEFILTYFRLCDGAFQLCDGAFQPCDGAFQLCDGAFQPCDGDSGNKLQKNPRN